MTPERLKRSEELPKPVLSEKGSDLLDSIFSELETYDGYKVEAAKAFRKRRRNLDFQIGNVIFHVDHTIQDFTERLTLVVNGKMQDKVTELSKKVIIKVNETFRDSLNQEITYEEQQSKKTVKKAENDQIAINNIQAIINGLRRKRPSSRSL